MLDGGWCFRCGWGFWPDVLLAGRSGAAGDYGSMGARAARDSGFGAAGDFGLTWCSGAAGVFGLTCAAVLDFVGSWSLTRVRRVAVATDNIF